MSRIAELRKTVTESTPVLVVVGATDVVVERVRATTTTAVARAEKVQAELEDALTTYQTELRKGLQVAQTEVGKTVAAYQVGLDPQRVQAKVSENLKEVAHQVPAAVQQAPALAVARALEVAGSVETGYAGLAERGKVLVERVRRQKPTQDLVEQGKATLTRTRAAVTTARKAVDDTTTAARSAVTIGSREAGETVKGVEQVVEQTVESSVEKTEQVVAQRTSGTRAAARRTTSTARKGAAATKKATKAAATSAKATTDKAEKAAEATAKKVGD
jgi:hypothetical protein